MGGACALALPRASIHFSTVAEGGGARGLSTLEGATPGRDIVKLTRGVFWFIFQFDH